MRNRYISAIIKLSVREEEQNMRIIKVIFEVVVMGKDENDLM